MHLVRTTTRDVTILRRASHAALSTVFALAAACGGGTSGPNNGTSDAASSDAPASESGVTDAAAADTASCSGSAALCDGVCVIGSCSFAITSMAPVAPSSTGDASDWVSGGSFFAVQGHGFSKGMRVLLGDGRAPVRVVDSTHAVIQTPPGPVGATDVRLVLGTQTSTTTGLFTYRTAAVDDTSPWQKVTMAIGHSDEPDVTVMPDGRALVSGGISGFAPLVVNGTAEVFSLATKTTTPAATPMTSLRWNHVGVALLDRTTAMFGAAGVSTYAGCDNFDVDIFDPTTNGFTKATGKPVEGLAGPRAVLLVDGRVLILDYQTTTAQIYDPDTQTFKSVPGAPAVNYWQNNQGLRYLTRLRDGRVLFVPGAHGQTWTFDSDTESFTKVGKGPTAGPDSLVTLPDGRVAAVGGVITVGTGSVGTDVIELWDPSAGGDFAPSPVKLLSRRMTSLSILQRDGALLVVAGATGTFPYPYGCGGPAAEGTTANVDRVDMAAGKVTPFAALPEANDYLVAGTLPDGSAVVAGGGRCAESIAYPYVYFRSASVK